MRLLFTALGAHGHLFPLMPLAVAAREAGHHVVFATAVDFRATLEKAGLEPATAGLTIGEAFASQFPDFTPGLARRELPPEELAATVGNVFGRVMPERFAADLRALFEQHRPDLVVYEVGNPGGAFAAKTAGIPAVGHGFGRVSTGGLMTAIDRSMREYADELGITEEGPAWGTPFVDICPPSVQSPEFLARTHRLPLRPVGWSDSGDLPSGVVDRDRSRPLVYLTLGTSPMSQAGVLTSAITGLSGLDADVLVATGPSLDPAVLGEVPPNVRLEAWVAQSALLPHVDLVVHHGGSGTTLGAFSAGAPQLVLPQGADQFANAEAVLASGTGARLLDDELTAESVHETAARLLTDPTVADAVRGVAAEVAAMPSPAEVAGQLPQYA